MRQLVIAALLAWTASAQMVVDSTHIPAAERRLAPHEGEKILRCYVDTSKPELNFSLRFQAGYVLGVPLVQYSGTGHSWQIVVKVTPEGGEPTYLRDRFELPNLLDPQYTGEASGTFLLGEGRYQVEFAAIDDKDRVCRKEWGLNATIGRGERVVKVAMPPHTVADLSWTGSAVAPTANPVPSRLTVLMNGSEPYQPWYGSPYRGVIVPHTAGPQNESPMDYRSAFLGILASLLEKLPGTAIRLVVFDLDQRKETLRLDDFTLKDIEKAAHAADNTDHWVVTVHELQEQVGPWDLLANLIRREIHAPEPSDAVLFLGPRIAPRDKMPPHFLDDEKGSALRFFYLQYRLSANPISYGTPASMSEKAPDPKRPPLIQRDEGLTPEGSDPIDVLVSRLKGKTLMVHSPVEFAKAVETIRQGSSR
jgi:hypothetical protein